MKALIEISGTGGELVVCPISAEAHDYWSNKSEENLEQYISDGNLEGHPKNSDFALDENGGHKSWFELDELGHFMGAHPNNCNLVVKVKSGNEFREVLNADLKRAISKTKSKLQTKIFARDIRDRKPAIQIFSYEKGNFFEGLFEFDTKKDFKDLTFSITNFGNEKIITSVSFKGQEIENIGGNTTSKGFFVELCHA